jgi:hypothetical protein
MSSLRLRVLSAEQSQIIDYLTHNNQTSGLEASFAESDVSAGQIVFGTAAKSRPLGVDSSDVTKMCAA